MKNYIILIGNKSMQKILRLQTAQNKALRLALNISRDPTKRRQSQMQNTYIVRDKSLPLNGFKISKQSYENFKIMRNLKLIKVDGYSII